MGQALSQSGKATSDGGKEQLLKGCTSVDRVVSQVFKSGEIYKTKEGELIVVAKGKRILNEEEYEVYI